MFNLNEVEFEVRVEPEDIPFVGNCSAVDEETDRANEAWVRDQLESGNDLAWCWVRVVARHPDYPDLDGEDSLGAVSCADQKDFEEIILADMKANALAELNAAIEASTRYTVEPGRAIYRDGQPFFRIRSELQSGHAEVDDVTRRIAALLNKHGEG